MASTDTFRVGVLFVPMYVWVVDDSLVHSYLVFVLYSTMTDIQRYG